MQLHKCRFNIQNSVGGGRDRKKGLLRRLNRRESMGTGLKPQILKQRKPRPKDRQETTRQFQLIRNIFLIMGKYRKVENI